MTTTTKTPRPRTLRRAAVAAATLAAAAGAGALLPIGESSAEPHTITSATRTWVSGVGDDANPCSRTAPCKTFAGAISKTSEGGEINVLDPGAFGAVTITKAITISSVGFEAGVLATAGSGIIVNAGADDDVVLRGLDLDGYGTGVNGINFLAGASLHVEDTTINNFVTAGINFAPTTAGATLKVDDVRVTEVFAAAGIGIWVHPNGVSATATIDDSSVATSTFGIKVESGGTATVSRSVIDKAASGVWASAATTKSEINLLDVTVTGGTQYGVRSQGDNAVLTMAGVHLSGNALGIKTFGVAKAISYGTNVNRDGGAPTQTVALQ